MSKLLNREFIVKRKVWQILVESILYTVAVTIALYLFFKYCDAETIKVLTNIYEEKLAFRAAMVFFPPVLIFMTMFKLIYFIYDTYDTNKKKKNN